MTKISTRLFFCGLQKFHRRSEFSCGIASLDNYLQKQASQDIKRFLSATYVLTDEADKIYGFYSLSAYSLFLNDLPEDLLVKLPRYPIVPAILIGRLAVNKEQQGEGYGQTILMDALNECALFSEKIGAALVIVEAINESAKQFYLRYGFIELPAQPNKLFIPMKAVMQLCTGESTVAVEMSDA